MKTPAGQIGPDHQLASCKWQRVRLSLSGSKMTPFDWQPALQPAELRDSLR